jgi:hypothetical protein
VVCCSWIVACCSWIAVCCSWIVVCCSLVVLCSSWIVFSCFPMASFKLFISLYVPFNSVYTFWSIPSVLSALFRLSSPGSPPLLSVVAAVIWSVAVLTLERFGSVFGDVHGFLGLHYVPSSSSCSCGGGRAGCDDVHHDRLFSHFLHPREVSELNVCIRSRKKVS